MARQIDTIPPTIDENGAMLVTADASSPISVKSGSLGGDGRQVVTTAGTRVALASSTPAQWVQITAESDNTGVIVVGGAGTVVAALATRRGTPLSAGEDISLSVVSLSDVGLDSTVSGDGVTYLYGV